MQVGIGSSDHLAIGMKPQRLTVPVRDNAASAFHYINQCAVVKRFEIGFYHQIDKTCCQQTVGMAIAAKTA